MCHHENYDNAKWTIVAALLCAGTMLAAAWLLRDSPNRDASTLPILMLGVVPMFMQKSVRQNAMKELRCVRRWLFRSNS